MTHLAVGTGGHAPRTNTRVLVVDDSDQLVSLIGAWLETEGYPVATATTGSRALAAAVAEPPDIVLLDLILPPPDGFTVFKSLAASSRPPIVIIITGLSDQNRLRQLDGLGAFAVLRKPLTEEAVLDVVSRARRLRWEQASRETGHLGAAGDAGSSRRSVTSNGR